MLRKFRAQQLFDGQQLHNNDKVLILRNDGSIEALVPAEEAGDEVEFYEGILCPGFVNSHCHLELSHLAGIVPQHNGLPQFLQAVMKSTAASPELQLAAMQAADRQMLKNGIVAVGDICNTAVSLPVKENSRLLYYNFIETMGLVDAGAPKRFASALSAYQQFARRFSGNSIVPHAPYSLGRSMWELVGRFEENRLLSIHSQESAAEEQLFRNADGPFLAFYESAGLPVSPLAGLYDSELQATLSLLPASIPLILVHNVETTEQHLRWAFSKRQADSLFFCLCPAANLYISNKLPDIPLLDQMGVQLLIGTDSLASNESLSILAEIQIIRERFPQIALEKSLRWSTLNGAKALQMDNQLGSFEPGKKPGVLLLSKTLNQVQRLM